MTDGTKWRAYLSSQSLQIVRMYVTWQVAQEILDYNTRNRSFNPRRLRDYVDLMRRKLWTADHPATIAITKDGLVIDGQHRLQAMVDTQTNLVLNIAFGCADEAKLTIDGHRPKSHGDRLWISNLGVGETPGDHAESGQIAHRMMMGPSTQKDRTSIEELTDFIQMNRDAITFVMDNFKSKARRGVTVSPVKAVVGRAYYHVQHDLLRRFVHVMLTGEVNLMDQGHNEKAILLARNWLMESHHAKNSNMAGEIYRRTSRALEAYVNNEPLRMLKSISYDPYPLPEMEALMVEAV